MSIRDRLQGLVDLLETKEKPESLKVEESVLKVQKGSEKFKITFKGKVKLEDVKLKKKIKFSKKKKKGKKKEYISKACTLCPAAFYKKKHCKRKKKNKKGKKNDEIVGEIFGCGFLSLGCRAICLDD